MLIGKSARKVKLMIDLHIHSRCSDGTMDEDEIFRDYRERGFRYIAITDHDKICDRRDRLYGSRPGLRVIPGVEVSTYDYERKRKIHLLGYFVDGSSPRLCQLLARIGASRARAASFIITGLQKMGYQIMESEVRRYAGQGGIYKQHILHCLKDKGYVRKMFGDLDKSLFKRGGKLYYPIDYADYLEGLQAIKEAGGLAVLAHPGQNRVYDLVGDLKENGLDGIETYHPTHTEQDHSICRELARNYNLFQIAGSDNHGMYTRTSIDFTRLQLPSPEEERLVAVLEGAL